jgi:hypothetical protein
MASELRVNTLKDAAGANSVGMAYVAGGSAKAWANFNGTGTIATRDSFNVTSLDDNGTGNYDVNFTNAMGNADFSSQVTAGYSADTGRYGENLSYNASYANVGARNSSGASVDNAGIAVTISGDLA